LEDFTLDIILGFKLAVEAIFTVGKERIEM
jgi:hypothetical protein